MKIYRYLRFQLVLSLVLFVGLSAAAQNDSGTPDLFSTIDSSKSLTDLMFMPSAGHAVTVTSYSLATSEVEVEEKSSQLLFAKSKDTIGTAAITGVYGISDCLLGSLRVGYLIGRNSKLTYGPASSSNGVTDKLRSQGLEDIELGTKYRLLQQENDQVNLDIGFLYSPKLQVGKDAEVGKTGDGFRGGDKLGLLFQMGNKFQQFSYMLEAVLNTYSERATKDSATTYKTTGGNDLSIRLMGQYKFNDSFLADFGFGRGSVDSSKLVDGSGTVTKEKSADGFGVFVSGQIALEPGSEYISIDYSRVTLGQHSLESAGTDYNVSEAVSSTVGLRFIKGF